MASPMDYKENSVDLDDYTHLMMEDYTLEEACKCDFFCEYIPENKSSPSSNQSIGSKAVGTSNPLSSNSENGYVPTSVSN